VNKAVNSNMAHAIEQGVARGIFPDAAAARAGIKSVSDAITKSGWPKGTIPDTARLDRFLVPIGNGGGAVCQLGANGTAKLKTILIDLTP
jgi:hypothetical protein